MLLCVSLHLLKVIFETARRVQWNQYIVDFTASPTSRHRGDVLGANFIVERHRAIYLSLSPTAVAAAELTG